jgi:hypothetical protein
MASSSMRNVNYIYADGYVTSIRQRLQIIQNKLFDSNDKTGKTNLLEAMAYLEKATNQLPCWYGRQIASVISEVRHLLSQERN